MLLLIRRKEYDHAYGSYSNELANIQKACEILISFNFEFNNMVIITSPFEPDKQSAEFLKKTVRINQKIQESELLIFTKDIVQNINALLDNINQNNQITVIVACQVVMAYILKEVKKRNFKMQETFKDTLYICNYL